MDPITLSKEEYLSLLNVVEEADKLVHSLNQGHLLDVNIAICKTMNSFARWQIANKTVPPTINVFNGVN